MLTYHCAHCRLPLHTATVSLCYQGTQRDLRIQFNGVPALQCPECRTIQLLPSIREHLEDLTPDEAWHLRIGHLAA